MNRRILALSGLIACIGTGTRKVMHLQIRSLKHLHIAAIVCLYSLLGTSSVLADTATGNQNPDLEVVVTLASSGSDPERATAGDTLTATWTVINKTNRNLKVNIEHIWEPPQFAVHAIHRIVTIPAQGSSHQSGTFLITSNISTGTFSFYVSATDDFGRGYKSYSTATANVTIY